MIARIREGNLWELHDNGEVIGITTNGSLKQNGDAVLGAGIGKQAKERYPLLPSLLGKHIEHNGNVPGIFKFEDKTIITVPVKNEWFKDADINLIKKSLRTIRQFSFDRIYITKPGVLNGRLDWNKVRQEITPILNNSNLYIVDLI